MTIMSGDDIGTGIYVFDGQEHKVPVLLGKKPTVWLETDTGRIILDECGITIDTVNPDTLSFDIASPPISGSFTAEFSIVESDPRSVRCEWCGRASIMDRNHTSAVYSPECPGCGAPLL